MPPRLTEVHAPDSQSKTEGGEEAMMGGLCRLVVRVWLCESGCKSWVGWLFVL